MRRLCLLACTAFVYITVFGSNGDSAVGSANLEPLAMTATFTPASIEQCCKPPRAGATSSCDSAEPVASVRTHGYRGIWFTLGQPFPYGDKYSGGLGTYTANHQPMAVYAPAVDKTFFTWGGTLDEHSRSLAIMVSYYDHSRHEVPEPVVLYLDPSVDDPHDNASLHIDAEGYIWIFKSGRSVHRPGLIFRSAEPWSIDAFHCPLIQEFTYPQAWQGGEDGSQFLLFTKYGAGLTSKAPARNLFWKTRGADGLWSEDHALASFGGHYQVSARWSDGSEVKHATFFNYHPQNRVDARTNVYYAQTDDNGKSWTSVSGEPLALPLTDPQNPALVLDLEARGQYMYTCDLNFDTEGNPVLLFVTSDTARPGPGERSWTILHWDGQNWKEHIVAPASHNYDMGSLLIDGEQWTLIAPTSEGPQPYGAGGEVALWRSTDAGESWQQVRELTAKSKRNHSYVRRSEGGSAEFAVFWADGDTSAQSQSRLYFSNAEGTAVWQLPYVMEAPSAAPEVYP